MTDIVDRLRERRWAPDADHILDEAADEIVMLRADLLKAEMKAEISDIEDVSRLVAIGRREGIEAALAVVRGIDTADIYSSGERRAVDEVIGFAQFLILALLEEPGRD